MYDIQRNIKFRSPPSINEIEVSSKQVSNGYTSRATLEDTWSSI